MRVRHYLSLEDNKKPTDKPKAGQDNPALKLTVCGHYRKNVSHRAVGVNCELCLKWLKNNPEA